MRKTILLLCVLLCVTASAHGAEDLSLQAMETLRNGFAGTSDFVAEIRQEKHLAQMKQSMVSKGVVRFKKPDSFFMELYPPHASRLLMQDNLMILRFPEQRVTDRVVLPAEEGLKRWFAYLANTANMLPDGVDAKAERHGKLWSVQLAPRNKGAVQRLTISFDSDGTIGRIVIDERNRDRTILSFSNLRRNVGLQDKDFRVE
jgi:outer membrane lipoprotein carrier protein